MHRLMSFKCAHQCLSLKVSFLLGFNMLLHNRISYKLVYVPVVFKITYSPKGQQHSDPNRLIRGSNVA